MGKQKTRFQKWGEHNSSPPAFPHRTRAQQLNKVLLKWMAKERIKEKQTLNYTGMILNINFYTNLRKPLQVYNSIIIYNVFLIQRYCIMFIYCYFKADYCESCGGSSSLRPDKNGVCSDHTLSRYPTVTVMWTYGLYH